MNPQLEAFVNQRLPLPGLLAWGAILPNGDIENHGYHDGFRSNQMPTFLKRLRDLCTRLNPDPTQTVHFCWTFQLVRVYAIAVPQRASLMLFLRNEERLPIDAARKVLTDFDKITWQLTEEPEPSKTEKPHSAEPVTARASISL